VIDAILTNTVLPRISREYLNRLTAGQSLKAIRLGAREGDFTYAFD
jgi:type VI secretion system protein VasG